ncbi:peptidoglycan DD-metalloendopeptidase family protein [Lentzea tibetensis]|uniref:Peptidoglycan DD-metalloendopeptidase family protein n=1 Tax=Lentzea tibetensis TaxID=2591470 RepID=A0A563EQY4_9PSEU|nr:peptidoglycan DD-metalloendopeptidase family protein [Lentzea tibetensis]TWP49905.1 peptidoglycan DD-metalloendopeptidase family protein [Lentzea tibetensis]
MNIKWSSPVLALLALSTVLVVPAHADERPPFLLPFACGQEWVAATRSDHSPNPNSLDFTKVGGGSNGQPIVAAAAGRVTFAGWDSGGGWMVNISHANGWGTTYLHMIERPSVGNGQNVYQGFQLGKVGSTGNSSGPHLHFQQWRTSPSNTVRSEFNGWQVTVGVGRSQRLKSQNCTPLEMKNAANTKCLDAAAGGGSGAAVTLYDCWGGNNQKWVWEGNQLKNSANGKCLDAEAGAANGARVMVYDCWDGRNQQWWN